MSNVYVIPATTTPVVKPTGVSASEVITDALQELIVQASEQPVEAVDMQTGIRYLNRMMAEFDSNGISLGFTVISNPADIVTVAAGAIGGIVFNLALRLAGTFDVQVSASLVSSARTGLEAMRKIGVTIQQTSFGGTLPVGSGNEGGAFGVDHFYDDITDKALTETDGDILLEDNT